MTLISTRPPAALVYPESDGEPLADNTKQCRWIFVLLGNLAALFRDVPDVFVAGNLLWYPVEGEPEVRAAPDVFVAFGRPKGDRRSYKQWEEDDVPVTVAFEILSPKNTYMEMIKKMAFYEDHGVEEYYVYDPDTNSLEVCLRRGEQLLHQWKVNGFVSPRLGIRFDLSGPELVVYGPDGKRFLTFEELKAVSEMTEKMAKLAEKKVELAEKKVEVAEKKVEVAEKKAEDARRRSVRMAELSRKARLQQARRGGTSRTRTPGERGDILFLKGRDNRPCGFVVRVGDRLDPPCRARYIVGRVTSPSHQPGSDHAMSGLQNGK